MKRTTTTTAKKEDIKRKWFIVDAKGATLGRLAAAVSAILRGKDKPIYSPHLDCGDFVVIINAKEVKASGNKEDDKLYFTHSGYPGGDKQVSLGKLRKTDPVRIVHHAIKGMLPPNKLSDRVITKLKIYPGPEHPHKAQAPESLKI